MNEFITITICTLLGFAIVFNIINYICISNLKNYFYEYTENDLKFLTETHRHNRNTFDHLYRSIQEMEDRLNRMEEDSDE